MKMARIRWVASIRLVYPKFVSKFHRSLFDTLSSIVNACDWDTFNSRTSELQPHLTTDPDTACILLYLEASGCVIRSDLDTCKHIVNRGLELAAFTRVPGRFTIQLLSLKIWCHLKERRHGEVQSELDDAMQIIVQDPVTCSGMAAGWTYVNHAKHLMYLTLASVTDIKRTYSMLNHVKLAYQTAMDHFGNDDGNDGPYGFNYAALKLASALLGCDDSLTLISLSDICQQTDLDRAADLIHAVDNSKVGVARTLVPLLYMAQADYKYRLNIPKRALELAIQAVECAQEFQLWEEMKNAQVRCHHYGRAVSSPACFTSLIDNHPSDADSECSDDSSRPARHKKKRKRHKYSGRTNKDRFTYSILCGAIITIVVIVLILTNLTWYNDAA